MNQTKNSVTKKPSTGTSSYSVNKKPGVKPSISKQKPDSNDKSLEEAAIAELLKEAQRGSNRAEVGGALAWKKPPKVGFDHVWDVSFCFVEADANEMEEEKQRMVKQFSQLRVFAVPPLPVRKTPPANQKLNRMDGLVQDLNSALEESTRSEISSTSSASSKRKLLRRRCKSTCNLSTSVTTTAAASNVAATTLSQQSEDSSTSSLEDNVGLGVSSRGERGTSSLQLTDSDELNNTGNTVSATRKKRSESWNSSRVSAIAGNESDSHNENISPVRPNTKRKRKFKRMAIDPMTGSYFRVPVPAGSVTPSGTIKRKKGRSKSVSEKSSSGPSTVALGRLSSPKTSAFVSPSSARQRQSSGVVPGKRKRSTREKSVETDLNLKGGGALAQGPRDASSMDCDDERRSSSSLSSTEWEDQDSGAEDDPSHQFKCDDGEADDEQSDWHETPGPGTVYLLTDDEDSSDLPMCLFANEGTSNEMQMESFNKLTSTARQAYLARMKRLAECVPGREIRAGTRRIRTRQSGFTIKSSSSEQLSRFLQDPTRTHLRLSVLRGADRSKIVHLANLYSLTLRHEEPHVLVLSKTGKTVKVDEFLVPRTPAAKQPVEVKRRKRTPPPAVTDNLMGQASDVIGMEDEDDFAEESSSKNFDEISPKMHDTNSY